MPVDLILPKLAAHQANVIPDQLALIFDDQGREETRTYRQLWINAKKAALALSRLGIGAHDRVGILLQNHPEFIEVMIATGILGAVAVPIDPRTKDEKLSYMLRDSGCRGVVCGDYTVEALRDPAVADAGLEWIYVVGSRLVESAGGAKIYRFSDIYASGEPEVNVISANADDAMEIMYTSGTTGDPKGIVVRHSRFVMAAAGGEIMFGYGPHDRPYTGLSLTHGNAQFVTLAPAMRLGIPVVFSRKFTKSRLWSIVQKYGCTTFSLLGGMATAIYSEPIRPDEADNPVRFVVSAGMPATIWNAFASRFDVRILEFYGAMEGGMAVNPINVGPVGSCGRAVPNLIAKVVDDDGKEVPPGTPGELWFRPVDGSPAVVEYHNNKKASDEKTAGGWLHMGDVVTMDKDGWIFYQYRKGGGIRRNGDFINPAFLEKAIAEHPGVGDVAVFGVPAASGAPGEMDVVAAIVPGDGHGIDPSELFGWCRDKVEPNMNPSYIMMVNELPKTASEKVQPRFLVDMFTNREAGIFYLNNGIVISI